MPANRAAGVAIAMEHCSDLRQIGAYRVTLHSRSHFDLSKECIKHSPSLPAVADRRSVSGKIKVNHSQIHSQSTFIQLTPHFTVLDIWKEMPSSAFRSMS